MSAPHFFQTRPGLTVGEIAALTGAAKKNILKPQKNMNY